MALFELDNGRLIPAQFGREVPDGFTPDILDAIRAQVLEIVSRPLFPITWAPIGPESVSRQDSHPRLTSLDASGQVVSVEVVQRLDAETLIDALSRLADTAAMSWLDLARRYPTGAEGFKKEWVSFRDAMPTSPPNGPRLILVASNIDSEVRPALDVLSSSGVEVHQMSLRQMTNGRAFLEVDAVGQRLYGHRASSLVEMGEALPALAAEVSGTPDRRRGRDVKAKIPPAPLAPQPAPRSRTSAGTRRSAQPSSAQAASRFPSRRQIHRGLPAEAPKETTGSGLPTRRRMPIGAVPNDPPSSLGHDAQGLATLARLSGDTPLALRPASRTPRGAQLTARGTVVVPSGEFLDPTRALVSEGIAGEDGWSAWSLGDEYGPTLAEAIAEVNRSHD